jgi:hypothetical protein
MPPIFFNRSIFGCGDQPAVYSGHCEKKGIGRRSRVSAYHKSACSYLPLGLESLSILSTDLGTPFARRSFKSANKELSVFHFQPPPRHLGIRVRLRDRKLTEVWCYRGGALLRNAVDGLTQIEFDLESMSKTTFEDIHRRGGALGWCSDNACQADIRTIEVRRLKSPDGLDSDVNAAPVVILH